MQRTKRHQAGELGRCDGRRPRGYGASSQRRPED